MALRDPRALALKGSVTMAVECLGFAINSLGDITNWRLCVGSAHNYLRILFHRRVYPMEDFAAEKRYGIELLMAVNDDVIQYLEDFYRQAEGDPSFRCRGCAALC